MERLAAEVGLKPDEVYEYEPRELYNYMTGVRTSREHIEAQYKAGWEQARLIYSTMVNYIRAQGKHPGPAKRPEQLMPFPWDSRRVNTQPSITREEGLRLADRYKEKGLI